MKILITETENGKYINKKGKRFDILTCTWVKGERAKDFKDFDTLEEAIEHYGLTEVKYEDKGL